MSDPEYSVSEPQNIVAMMDRIRKHDPSMVALLAELQALHDAGKTHVVMAIKINPTLPPGHPMKVGMAIAESYDRKNIH